MLNKQTAKLIAVIAQNLPEMSDKAMQRYIDDPKEVQKNLRQAFLNFSVLMTVKLGTGLNSADDFRQALKEAGMILGDQANNLLNQSAFKVADQPTDLNIVAPTLAELGFNGGACHTDCCKRGLELGHGLCPTELGPQLRLQYQDQPKGEVLILFIEPIYILHGSLNAFAIGHSDDGLWLNAFYAGPGYFYFKADSRFVFVSAGI